MAKRDILKKYQDRLNDLSRRNRSIRISRIIKKKSFDVSSLSELEEGRDMKLLNSLFYLGRSFNILSLNTKSKEEERIMKEIDYLKRETDFILKEKGYYECYLGYPFIQGNFSDGSFFRAPLFLVPVKIEKNRTTNKMVLSVLDNSEVQINKTFFLAFNKYNAGIKQVDIAKISDLEEIPKEELIAKGLSIFKDMNFEIDTKHFSKDKILSLPILKQDQCPKDETNKITLLPYAIVGHFNQISSALNNDYEDIIKNNKTNELSELILGNKSEVDLEERYNDEKVVDSPEKDNFFITIPDISQEEVLIRSRSGKGLVIHGPPGTGKSQVITNMIADGLLRKKKILVVCEKRAALDVVKNRLASKGINKHCLLIHDSQNDRDRIFKQIEIVLEEFDSLDDGRDNNSISSNKIYERANSFDLKLLELKKAVDLMHAQQRFGSSLINLYRNSPKNRKLKLDLSKKEFNEIKYPDLDTILEKINKVCKQSYLFDNEEHPLYFRKRFKSNFDETTFKDEIKKLNETIKSIENIIFTKEFKSDLSMIKKNKNITLEDFSLISDELKEFIEIDNKKLARIFDTSWWHLKTKYKLFIERNTLGEDVKKWSSVKKLFNELDRVSKYLESVFENDFLKNIESNVLNYRSSLDMLKKLNKSVEDLDEIISFDINYEELSDAEKNVLNQCKQIIASQTKNLHEVWQETIRANFYLKWITEVESTNPLLKEFSNEKYDSIQKRLKELLKEKSEFVPHAIFEHFLSMYKTLKWKSYDYDGRRKNYNNLADLLHEVGKKRRKMTLREFFQMFQNQGLLDLFPCWLCSPETASSTFPMKENIFDIVIFDEASQCKLERAIPAIMRGKRLIVAGDEKQLPPTTFFMSSTEEDEEDNYEEADYNEKQLLENESLLERAKPVLEGKRLIYHYRSNHEDLINFSNFAFYGKFLRVVPKNESNKEPSIKYKNTRGVWDAGVNQKEAEAVVEYIKDFLKKNKSQKTIGVITFNIKQKDLIEELLDKEAANDPKFASLLDSERERHNNEENIGLFVKNIENVQGDERDVIVFSVSYGFDKTTGKFQYRFGPLNGAYGPNRLNVAISRAKEKVMLFTSFEPSDLKYEGSSEGPKLLRSYLEYSKFISEGKTTDANNKLASLNNSAEIVISDYDSYDSDFEGEVRDALTKLGYSVKTQVGCKGYKIDLAVENSKEKGKFIVGIECDGAKYHSSKSAKDRDVYRQRILEDAGWKIIRIWSRDWWKDEQAEIKRIDREIKRLQ